MTKQRHDPLITIISHSLSIDMQFINGSVDMIVLVIPSQDCGNENEVCCMYFYNTAISTMAL